MCIRDRGYTVDKIAQNFDKLGIENYLIEIGGEVYAKGSHKNKKPWKVGIEKPPVSMYSPCLLYTSEIKFLSLA